MGRHASAASFIELTSDNRLETRENIDPTRSPRQNAAAKDDPVP